jgi:hypothetical protein
MTKRMKYKITGTAVSFFSITLFLLVTALATTTCPVCGGTGTINSTPGAEKVSILGFEDVEFPFQKDVCGVYTIYKHGITMELLNEGDVDINTWIKLTLLDTVRDEGSNLIDTQYVRIMVPAKTVVKNSFKVYFGTGIDVPDRVKVQTEVVVGGVPDDACDGRGRVSLNTWPFTAALKNIFVEGTRQENVYRPPVVIAWENLLEDPDH